MALTIIITLTNEQVAALKHDLPGEAGIHAWLRAAIDGKAQACEKRMAQAGLALVQNGTIQMNGLSDLRQETLAAALRAHAGYQDRAARDAAERPPSGA